MMEMLHATLCTCVKASIQLLHCCTHCTKWYCSYHISAGTSGFPLARHRRLPPWCHPAPRARQYVTLLLTVLYCVLCTALSAVRHFRGSTQHTLHHCN